MDDKTKSPEKYLKDVKFLSESFNLQLNEENYSITFGTLKEFIVIKIYQETNIKNKYISFLTLEQLKKISKSMRYYDEVDEIINFLKEKAERKEIFLKQEKEIIFFEFSANLPNRGIDNISLKLDKIKQNDEEIISILINKIDKLEKEIKILKDKLQVSEDIIAKNKENIELLFKEIHSLKEKNENNNNNYNDKKNDKKNNDENNHDDNNYEINNKTNDENNKNNEENNQSFDKDKVNQNSKEVKENIIENKNEEEKDKGNKEEESIKENNTEDKIEKENDKKDKKENNGKNEKECSGENNKENNDKNKKDEECEKENIKDKNNDENNKNKNEIVNAEKPTKENNIENNDISNNVKQNEKVSTKDNNEKNNENNKECDEEKKKENDENNNHEKNIVSNNNENQNNNIKSNENNDENKSEINTKNNEERNDENKNEKNKESDNKMLFDSEITNINEIDFIITFLKGTSLFKGKNFKFDLLYRGTRDGDNTIGLHRKCCGLKNIILFMKSEQGYIYGGFTHIGWETRKPEKWEYPIDNKAFLFSLNKKKVFKAIKGKNKMCWVSSDSYGLSFYESLMFYNKFFKVENINIGDKTPFIFKNCEISDFNSGIKKCKLVELEVYQINF